MYNAPAQPLFYTLNLFLWWRSHCRCRHGLLNILDLCLRKSHDYRDAKVVFRKLCFQNVFRSHENAFSDSPGLNSVFEKLRIRDVLVWTVGVTVEMQRRFQISPA